ncbi:MAG TPA: hypothetical protein PK476_00620, partial [Candidatus Pacearchaeota archaeon]|nr:hypothetical protein [Candidatus Pacearchaeota archaeon]HQM24397.1 hypothetical protein [Candidatus Pacearchaeota archaeon]
MKKNKEKTKRILSLIVIFFSILIIIFSIGFVSADLILDFNTETSFDTGSDDLHYYCGPAHGGTYSSPPSPYYLCDSGAFSKNFTFDTIVSQYKWECEITIVSGATETTIVNYCSAYFSSSAILDTTPPTVTIMNPVSGNVSGT